MPSTINNIPKTVLIAPLDWGLGHTTRCIPIIKAFIDQGCTVIVAANHIRKALLLEIFPTLTVIPIPDYAISYSKGKWLTLVKLFLQIKKIKAAIAAEQQWLQHIITTYNVAVVVSDNRYGLHNTNATTVFITHQLKPKSPFWGIGERLLQKQLYQFINKFNYCWVYDNESIAHSLAGELSHPKHLPSIPTTFIGVATRLTLDASIKITCNVLVLLSGPEPQRTLLEEKIIKQLETYNGKAIIIRGVSLKRELPKSKHTLHNLLPINELNTLINESAYVVCRSGYTSVMDLLLLQKRCIFIPTPGQTEQEYLAQYLSHQQFAFYTNQSNFNLHNTLAAAEQIDYTTFNYTANNIVHTVTTLLQSL